MTTVYILVSACCIRTLILYVPVGDYRIVVVPVGGYYCTRNTSNRKKSTTATKQSTVPWTAPPIEGALSVANVAPLQHAATAATVRASQPQLALKSVERTCNNKPAQTKREGTRHKARGAAKKWKTERRHIAETKDAKGVKQKKAEREKNKTKKNTIKPTLPPAKNQTNRTEPSQIKPKQNQNKPIKRPRPNLLGLALFFPPKLCPPSLPRYPLYRAFYRPPPPPPPPYLLPMRQSSPPLLRS